MEFSLKTLQSEIPMEKFGWFYARNGTTWSDGILNMATGADKVSTRKWNHVERWNSQHGMGADKVSTRKRNHVERWNSQHGHRS
jgi:hypothetical protein